jgi:hypothetical protein
VAPPATHPKDIGAKKVTQWRAALPYTLRVWMALHPALRVRAQRSRRMRAATVAFAA